jgi:hypothetical protein
MLKRHFLGFVFGKPSIPYIVGLAKAKKWTIKNRPKAAKC